MKKIFLAIAAIISISDAFTQSLNPYEQFGYQTKKEYVMTKPEGIVLINTDTSSTFKSLIISLKTNQIFLFNKSDSVKVFDIQPQDLARFKSVDPLTKKYPELTPYQFASNTPIQGIDLDGLEHYYTADGKLLGKYGKSTEIRIVNKDYVQAANFITSNPNVIQSDVLNIKLYNSGTHGVFGSNDAASLDWSQTYNSKSIKDNREYVSNLYEIKLEGMTYTTYTQGAKGSPAGANPDDAPVPNGILRTGIIHSHGAYDRHYDNNNFSTTGGDIDYFKIKKVDGYVATPEGSLKKYEVGCNTISTLTTDLPSDSKDPNRKNQVDPEERKLVIPKNK